MRSSRSCSCFGVVRMQETPITAHVLMLTSAMVRKSAAFLPGHLACHHNQDHALLPQVCQERGPCAHAQGVQEAGRAQGTWQPDVKGQAHTLEAFMLRTASYSQNPGAQKLTYTNPKPVPEPETSEFHISPAMSRTSVHLKSPPSCASELRGLTPPSLNPENLN